MCLADVQGSVSGSESCNSKTTSKPATFFITRTRQVNSMWRDVVALLAACATVQGICAAREITSPEFTVSPPAHRSRLAEASETTLPTVVEGWTSGEVAQVCSMLTIAVLSLLRVRTLCCVAMWCVTHMCLCLGNERSLKADYVIAYPLLL